MRVAMVTTHPIQYQVPWLRLLGQQAGIELQVFFAMVPDAAEQGREFGVAFEWDMPLLEGYAHTVLENVAKRPSLTEFRGCDTPGIGRALREGRFDAVIVNGWGTKMALQALWACKRQGIPCIVRGEANGLRPRARWKRFLHARLLARYAACLAIGSNNRDYLRAAGVPDKRIFATPYCIDNLRFRDAAERWRQELGVSALRARFGLDSARTVFLFSGKFVEKKRPGDIIEAVRRLPEVVRSNIQILLVGDGPLREQLQQAAQGLPVHFAGFLNQSEITAAYAASDALLLPSDSGETWGLVVNEAMACGLPALVSDQVGCAVDLVTPGATGEVFGCGDVAALAALLKRYAAKREALAQMGQAAQARVLDGYNFGRVVDGAMAALTFVTETSR
ncbi:MAG: glycosyltransferase family 4 protein [Thermomonas sp.]|uniref:glycosyltransferase family 4 protein n=1 Tax=Thermomonas sp. TaxID=1971895 RepID=UPI001D85D455|nr:glycosyltransferase family 4 protein [Thermomonas sp.]MBZ0087658.1 glycosyltransferase family 4 protein [Thermomonas sp.]